MDARYQHPNIHLLGFTQEIGKLMEASDLLVTKPGGMTCSEGLAKSIPMLFYMGAASHYTLPSAGNHAAYWVSLIVLIALIEINALTATSGATTKPIEKIPGVIVTGFVVWGIAYELARAFLAP